MEKEIKKDIFISYSRKDLSIVDKIVRDLEALGYSIWIDRDGVYSGGEFKREIVHAIEDCKVVLFFSSQHSNNSEWTAKEIGVAVDEKKHIIPILLDNSKFDTVVKFDLININYIDFTDQSHYKEMLSQLNKTLSAICGGIVYSPPPPTGSGKKHQNKWGALIWKLFLACSVFNGMMTLYFLSNYAGLFTYRRTDWEGEWHDYNHLFDLIVGGYDFNVVLICSVLSCIVSAYIAYKIHRLSNNL